MIFSKAPKGIKPHESPMSANIKEQQSFNGRQGDLVAQLATGKVNSAQAEKSQTIPVRVPASIYEAGSPSFKRQCGHESAPDAADDVAGKKSGYMGHSKRIYKDAPLHRSRVVIGPHDEQLVRGHECSKEDFYRLQHCDAAGFAGGAFKREKKEASSTFCSSQASHAAAVSHSATRQDNKNKESAHGLWHDNGKCGRGGYGGRVNCQVNGQRGPFARSPSSPGSVASTSNASPRPQDSPKQDLGTNYTNLQRYSPRSNISVSSPRQSPSGLRGSSSAGLISSRCAQKGAVYACQGEGDNVHNHAARRKRDAPMAPPGGTCINGTNEAAGARSGWDDYITRGPKMMPESLIMKGDSFGSIVAQKAHDHLLHAEERALHHKHCAGATTIHLGNKR